jgi:hypothetical protein
VASSLANWRPLQAGICFGLRFYFYRLGRPLKRTGIFPSEPTFQRGLKVRVYLEEIGALYEAGCRHMRIDETNFPVLCDPNMHDRVCGTGARV